MPKYRIYLSGTASASLIIETDETNPEQIYEKAMEEGVSGLCAHCSGWGQNHSLSLPEEWEPDTDEHGVILVENVED